jgi:hypothetical protein
MEWITKVLEANPLSVALLVCVILALGVFKLVQKRQNGTPKDLAALAERVSLLEHDMERLAPKMDQCIEELIEWRTVLRGLKDSMDEKLDEVLRRIEDRKE